MTTKYKYSELTKALTERLVEIYDIEKSEIDSLCQAIFLETKAMLEAAQESEPVAWRNPNDTHRCSAFMWQQSETHSNPLYTQPPADKANAERWRYCVALKSFPSFVNHRLEESEDWCMVVNNKMIIQDTAEQVVDKAMKG